MAFMEPNYSDEPFSRVTNKYGQSRLCMTYYVPINIDLEDGETVEHLTPGKWFHQLSADGYMDQTDWCGPFDTLEEAREDLATSYDVDPDTGEYIDDFDPENIYNSPSIRQSIKES